MGKRKYESKAEEDGRTSPKQARPVEGDGETEEANEDSGSEFNIKHFRKELNAKQGQTIALTQFLQVCTNPDAKHDHMLQYLKAGGNSHEILRQLTQDDKKNLTLATPTFHLFHLIILEVQASMPHMIAITEEACRYFLNTFMPTVEIMISEHSGPKHRKIILKLFTSMVTLNPDLGIEILNQAPLTPKHLQYIVEKPNYKEKDNVRTAFVHFIISFLVEGHLLLIKALLEKQGLLSLVIPGLVQDDGEAVMMFLNILKTNVIENINLSKSLKLRTFSHQVLHNMFKIYYWKAPPEVEYQSKTEVQSSITVLLSEILLILFTSHKYGLYFQDKSLGTTDTHKNQNLYKALLSLKRPWENKNQREVIIKIVDKCPDLHRALITVIEQSFEPQNSPVWHNTATFVITLLDKIQPQDIIARMDHLTPLQITNFVRFTTLPIPLLKFLKQGINKNDIFVTTVCVKVLAKMLSAMKKYLDLLEIDNGNVTDLIKNRLEGFIPKHLPAPENIVSIIHDVMSPEKTLQTVPTEATHPDKASTLIVLFDLFLLYLEIHPTSLEGIEGYLDMKLILNYANTLTSENVLLLKFKIVSLWLGFDPSAISLKKPMFSDLFLIMLEIYTHDDEDISVESKNTLANFLKSTAMFENGEGEVDLVLHALRNAKVEPASLLVEAMKHTLANTEELKQFIRTQTVNVGLAEATDSVILDQLFENLSSDNIQNIDNNFFIDEKIPSPFVLGCLQVAGDKSKKDALKNFLSLYIANLLHYYTSPNLIANLLQPYKIEVKNYVSGWIQEPVSLNKLVMSNDETLNKINKYVMNDEEINLDEIFPHFEIVSEEQQDVNIGGTFLKFDTSASVDSSELIVWANMLIFHILQLTKLRSLKSLQLERITNCFDCIMAIGRKYNMVDICRKIMYTLFSNPLMLNFFTPIDKPKDPSNKMTTQFLLSVTQGNKHDINYLQSKLKLLCPFQQKIFVEVKKAIKKIAKKKIVSDDDHTLKILETIGMNKADCLTIVNSILEIDTKSMVTESNQPSLLIKILEFILIHFSTDHSNSLPSEAITNIFHLYTNILKHPEINASMIDFESTLQKYFENRPHHVELISKESFKNFFSSKVIRKSTSQLAAALLQRNVKLCDVFKVEIQNPEVIGLRELALPLGEAVVDHTNFINENKSLLVSIYLEYKSSIAKALEKPHKVGQIYSGNWRFIRKLIYECMEIEDCKKFFEKVHKFETVEVFHINLIQAVFMKICATPDSQKKDFLLNYFVMMINLLTSALKADCDYNILKTTAMNIYEVAQICKGVKSFETKDKEIFKNLIESSAWQNFYKAALKDSLRIKTSNESNEMIGPIMLSLLSTLVKLFYPYNHEDIVTLFGMVTSHSEFLNVMLSHHSTDIKSRLVEFLYVLILRNKSVMKGQQIPVYLSAYHATRNPGDRLILTILHFYETNGQPVHEYKPYVWGDSGANYYSVRKNRTSTLWGHPTPNQILNLLEKDIIEKTVTHFPVNQRLDYHYELPSIDKSDSGSAASLIERMRNDRVFEAGNKSNNIENVINGFIQKNKYSKSLKTIKEVELTSSSHCEDERDLEVIYDPSFILPIMSHLLAPGAVISCFKLVRLGLLSVPLAALASHCPTMRAAAYHVLHRFCQQLEAETKHRNDKLLLTDFVDTLRQSLSTAIVTAQKERDAIKDQKNPRLPAVAAVYLARALNAATAPFDPLYKPVNNFLIAKQQIDLTVVPDFLSLFHDNDVESADRRLWMIQVMRDGTKTMSDVNVVFKTMALKMIIDFYSTVLCDKKTKVGILEFLATMLSVPRAAEIMIEGYGIMSWLSGIVRQFKRDDKALVSTAIHLISNLGRSVSINAFAKMLSDVKKTVGKDIVIDINSFTELKINKELEQQILVLLLDLLPFISNLSLIDRAMYVSTFNIFSKKCLNLVNHKQIAMLVKTCSEGPGGINIQNDSPNEEDSDDNIVKASLVKQIKKLFKVSHEIDRIHK